jgi:DNA-binding transcriptional ArsR family regulator
MSRGNVRANAVDLIGLVVRNERTVGELFDLTGMAPDSIRSWLALLTEEGLVCSTEGPREGKRGRTAKLYRWVGHAD